MRLKINFYAEKLPIIYRHRLIALIKEALEVSSPEYKSFLYPDKESGATKRTKPFSFALLLPKDREIKKEYFHIDPETVVNDFVFVFPSKRFFLTITSCDYLFLIHLWNGLMKMRTFEFDNKITLKVTNATVITEKDIECEVVKFRTLSPVLIEDKSERPILPDNPLFNKHLNEVQDRILKDIRGHGLISKLELKPIKIRKSVVKHSLNGFRKLTGRPYMFLTCFEGIFYLHGDPVDLKYIYKCGLGLRTGQGFGTLEVI